MCANTHKMNNEFMIPKAKLAIIGPVGSGKTTLAEYLGVCNRMSVSDVGLNWYAADIMVFDNITADILNNVPFTHLIFMGNISEYTRDTINSVYGFSLPVFHGMAMYTSLWYNRFNPEKPTLTIKNACPSRTN